MPTSTATSQDSFQRVLREQETLVNKILGSSDNSSARLYAMQTMCYILLAFHTVKSTSNTFDSQTEDLLSLKLKDISVGKILGAVHLKWDLWVSVRGRNFRANARALSQRNESTFGGFPTNLAEDLAYDVPLWLISYLFVRGAFKEPFNTMQDLLNCKYYSVSIDPEKKSEPLFLGWSDNGPSILQPAEHQSLASADRAVQQISLRSGMPFERLGNIRMRWPNFIAGDRSLSISVALKTPAVGKGGIVYVLPKDHRSQTVRSAWDALNAAVDEEGNEKILSRARDAVNYLIAAYEGNIPPPSMSHLKRKAEDYLEPASLKRTKLRDGVSSVGQSSTNTEQHDGSGDDTMAYETCMRIIERFNQKHSSGNAFSTGKCLQTLLAALDRGKVEEFHRMDATQEVLSKENVIEGFDVILCSLVGSGESSKA